MLIAVLQLTVTLFCKTTTGYGSKCKMNEVKETSTIQLNKQTVFNLCLVTYVMANWAIEDGQKREEPLFKTMEQFPA